MLCARQQCTMLRTHQKTNHRQFPLVWKKADAAKPKIDKNPPAFDVKNMDTSVKPRDDFYTYANGAWLKNNPIPPE